MLIQDIIEYEFLQYAYLSGLIIAILFPIFGSFIVLRNQVFISDTISHISLAGVSIGYYLASILTINFNPTFFGISAAIIGAVLIEYMRSVYKGFKEIVMINVMCVSIAIAIIFASFNTSQMSFTSFLFGSINTINTFEIYALITLAIISSLFFYKNYYTLLGICIDEDYSKLMQKNYYIIKYTFVILTAILISLAIKIIGVLLISAMIVMPVTFAIGNSDSFRKSNIISIIFAFTATILGLIISYYISIPSGASIVIILALGSIINKFIKYIRR